ncbi:MAG TPA: META domain-containing protein [Candidatus Krumholzibacteria bacterium]
MKRACVWLMAILVVASASCAKKNGGQAEHNAGADSTGGVAASPGMAPVPQDSIPRGPWKWLGTVGPADTTRCPDPSQYTITFLPDSTARLLLFCNRGSGKYNLAGRSIHVGPIAMTRMACPPPTVDAEFGQQVESADTWTVSGDTLRLEINGFGTMHFMR